MAVHHHHHHHTHEDIHRRKAENVQRLRWVLLLTFSYFIIELFGSYFSKSIALLADAVHMLGDSSSILIALVAAWVSHFPTGQNRTFGFSRIEILAALFNGILLCGIAIMIVIEAFDRFHEPEQVHGNLMLVVAVGGLIINIVAARILHAHQHGNLNMRGAYLHVLSDLMGSVGAIVAAGLILAFGWLWADPLISCVIAVLVFYSAMQLILDAVNILFEGSPSHVDVEEVRLKILSFAGIQDIHNLHIWTINSDKIVLTAHLIVDEAAYVPETLGMVQKSLKQDFGLSHVTLQLELPHQE